MQPCSFDTPSNDFLVLRNHDIFTKYTKLVENLLESFLSSRGIEISSIFEACKRQQEGGHADGMMCLDYLLASTEYDSFMQLAYDHCQLCDYVPAGPLTEMWSADAEGEELEPHGQCGVADELSNH